MQNNAEEAVQAFIRRTRGRLRSVLPSKTLKREIYKIIQFIRKPVYNDYIIGFFYWSEKMLTKLNQKWQEKRAGRKEMKRYEKVLKKVKGKDVLYDMELLLAYIHDEKPTPAYVAEAYVKIAVMFRDVGKLEDAAKFYDAAFETGRTVDFYYNKEIDNIFEVFYKVGRHDLYKKWHENFMERARTQRRFKKFNVPSIAQRNSLN